MRTACISVLAALCLGASVPSAQAAHEKEKLVWKEDFTGPSAQPDAAVWSYEQGDHGWGNQELEMYCAYGSAEKSCDPQQPNAFLSGGMLHIVARKTADSHYTSARLLTRGKKAFQYGRIEARIRIPAGAGLWPAFWLLGADDAKKPWPACGEQDVMENIGKEPQTIHGSIHGPGFVGTKIGTAYRLAGTKPVAAKFHTFGMIWNKGSVAYYVDNPKRPYVVYTPADLPAGATWPFDDGPFYIILNLAVGGEWPGNPDGSTPFPAEMLVDWVKVWQK